MTACCTGKSSLTISAKPVGVGAASQAWILAGERSSSRTRIAVTENVFVVRADEMLAAFMELEKVTHDDGN